MPPPSRSAGKKKEKPVLIIKRPRARGAVARHGGAWKVAYADFVTAMMAFFLLLWLLSTSSKATLQGIAEYFTPTNGIESKLPMGTNAASPSALQETQQGINMSDPGVMQKQAGSIAGTDNPSQVDGEADRSLFKQGQDAMSKAISEDPVLTQYQDNIAISQTPEGLNIDIKDSNKYAMFERGSAELSDHGKAVLVRLVPIIKKLPNFMAVTGYTDTSLADSGGMGMERWQLSSGRANEALRFMTVSGLEPERAQRVVGAADTALLRSSSPRSETNRRVSLLLLRGSHMLIPDSAVPSGDSSAPAQ